MEFLGDSVLGFAIADMLFRQFPQHNEGQKSKLKASIVSAASLARLGEKIQLGEFLILGRGEEKTGGRRKHALIADCYEALIAAIYLDGGIEPARAFIERQFADLIQEARRTGAQADFTEDYKSALQEWLQSHDRGLPAYRLAGEVGPAHRRLFDVEVVVNGVPVARAEGKSKKEAAQAAAKLALDKLSAAMTSIRFKSFGSSRSSHGGLGSVDLDNPPRLFAFGVARFRAGHGEHGLAVRQPVQNVGVHFARDVFFAWAATRRRCIRTHSRIMGSAKLYRF